MWYAATSICAEHSYSSVSSIRRATCCASPWTSSTSVTSAASPTSSTSSGRPASLKRETRGPRRRAPPPAFPQGALVGSLGAQQGQIPGSSTQVGKPLWSFGPAAVWPVLDFGSIGAQGDIGAPE